MPKGVPRDWPPGPDLLALIADVGSVNKAAARLGIADKTLRSHLVREGLLDDAKRAVARAPTTVGDDDVSREELLEHELRELKRATGRARKDEVRAERVVRAVEEALRGVAPPRRAKPASTPHTPSGAHHRQMVLLSDWHGGEVVDPDVVNGMNEYNWQIMEERVDEVVGALLSHKRNSPTLTGLDVIFAGDMCSGANHEELAVTNEFPLAEQAVKMGALMGQTVERLVPHYANLRVVSVEGNHPRLSRKPASKNPHDNMDWVAAVFARQYLAPHKTVTFTIGRGSVRHTIAGRTYYCFHGDGIRSTMPGVPWGGVLRRVNTIQATQSHRIDGFILGHYHQANVVQGGRILMNGSLKGADEWTLKNFGGGERPAQLLATFDEKRSRMTDVRMITPTAGIP